MIKIKNINKNLKLILLISTITLTTGCNKKYDDVKIIYHTTMEKSNEYIEDAAYKGQTDASVDYSKNIRNDYPFITEENIAWNMSYANSYNDYYDRLVKGALYFNNGYSDGYNDAIMGNAINNKEDGTDSISKNYNLGYIQGYEAGIVDLENKEDELIEIKR